MWTVKVEIEGNEVFRASEVVADLRNVAETLFHPLRLVGFWDDQADGMHLCPYESSSRECPHHLPVGDPGRIEYFKTAERDLDAVLEVVFPHAGVHIYLK